MKLTGVTAFERRSIDHWNAGPNTQNISANKVNASGGIESGAAVALVISMLLLAGCIGVVGFLIFRMYRKRYTFS